MKFKIKFEAQTIFEVVIKFRVWGESHGLKTNTIQKSKILHLKTKLDFILVRLVDMTLIIEPCG